MGSIGFGKGSWPRGWVNEVGVGAGFFDGGLETAAPTLLAIASLSEVVTRDVVFLADDESALPGGGGGAPHGADAGAAKGGVGFGGGFEEVEEGAVVVHDHQFAVDEDGGGDGGLDL